MQWFKKNSLFSVLTRSFIFFFCVDRLVLGTLPVVTTPPTYPGRSPTCWASSVWYEPATGEPSKWATQRTASPRAGTARHSPAWLEEQTTLFSFFFLSLSSFRSDFQTGRVQRSGTSAEYVEEVLCVLEETYVEDVSCCVSVWNVLSSLNKPTICWWILLLVHRDSNPALVLPKYRIKNCDFSWLMQKWVGSCLI